MFQAIKTLIRTTVLWVLLLPYVFIFIGAASNQLVLIANGDKFPVLLSDARIAVLTSPSIGEDGEPLPPRVGPDGMLDARHCVMTHKTRLNFLADIFDFHTGWYSIGDELLTLGEWLSSFLPFVWGFEVVRRLRA